MPQPSATFDEEHLQATVQALSTLALCHQGQIVALSATVEAVLAVMSKSSPGLARQLAAHLAASAGDHADGRWQNDQRLAFDNQLNRLQALLRLLGSQRVTELPASPGMRGTQIP